MSFSDRGIVLSAQAHGETHAVVHLFTERFGRCAGLVHGGQGSRMRPILQAGNEVNAVWKGREQSLGYFTLELARARAAEAFEDRLSLAALSATCAVATAVLPEREVNESGFQAMLVLLDNLDDIDIWPALMARWELGLLSALGFGLTLDRCAATGGRDNLVYVSPRSACAVAAEAGEPYKDKLLPLPAFFRDAAAQADLADAAAGLRTTGFFLESRVLALYNKPLPEARRNLMEKLCDAVATRTAEGKS